MPCCVQMEVFEAKISIYYSILVPFYAVLSDFQVCHNRFTIKFRYDFCLYTIVQPRFLSLKKNIVSKCKKTSHICMAKCIYVFFFSNLCNSSHKTLWIKI